MRKGNVFTRTAALRIRRLLAPLVLLTGLIAPQINAAPVPSDKPSSYPAWWFEREVVKRTDPNNNTPLWANHDYPAADDFAAANIGQLKRIATGVEYRF